MDLFIFKEILYGELRPWLNTESDLAKKNIIAFDKQTGNTSSAYASLHRLLNDRPGLRDQLEETFRHTGAPPETSEPFTVLLPEQPFDRQTWFYKNVLDYAAELILQQTLYKLRNHPEKTDRIYRLNLATRNLLDILSTTGQMKILKSDAVSRYVLQHQKHHLITLLEDLSRRLPALREVERYSVPNLYLSVLNQPVPDQLPFRYTTAYQSSRHEYLLDVNAPDREIAEFRKELIQDKPGTPPDYSPVICHLENAMFLRNLNNSLFQVDRSKLTDESYCRQRISELHSKIIAEENPDRKTGLLHSVMYSVHCMNGIIPETSTSSPPSEAAEIRALIHHIETDSYSFRPPDYGGSSGASADSVSGNTAHQSHQVLLSNFNNYYISFDELGKLLHMESKTLTRFIKDHNIRKLELTSHNKWLVRDDVEQFISTQIQKP